MLTDISEYPLPSRVCLPGEPVLQARGEATVVLGSGLRQPPTSTIRRGNAQEDPSAPIDILAAVGGYVRRDAVSIGTSEATGLEERAPQYTVIAENARRYVPKQGDVVVGIVLRVNATNYSVHIGAAHAATLDVLAFDGASKINRPKLVVGDLVYAHVTVADPDAETELSCCAVGDMAHKDWSTGEAVFGSLSKKDGATVTVPLAHAAALIENRNTVLICAGGRTSFEAVIGQNGRVFVRAANGTPRRVLVALLRCVSESADCRDAAECEALVDRFFPAMYAAASGPAVPAPPAETASGDDAAAELPEQQRRAQPAPATAADAL